MNRYFTGLLLPNCQVIPTELRGRGWSVVSEPKPDSESRMQYEHGNEVVILARTAMRAQAGLDSILDGWTVLNTCLPGIDDLYVIPEGNTERETYLPKHFADSTWSALGFPFSCRIAQLSSMRRPLSYALALYHQSLALHHNEGVELDPALFPYRHRSTSHRDHVRFAYSIVLAYAVIETLGLALHGDAFGRRGWIPEKRAEFENRLTRTGVDIEKPVTWLMRGGKTKLEATRPPTVLQKCDWSYSSVRDCQVSVVDAIADLRWLRSGVAAHKISKLAFHFSAHDVSNAQSLARRLILNKLGYSEDQVAKLIVGYGFWTRTME